MQLQFGAKNGKTSTSTVNTSTTNTHLVPSTTRITKEYDGSISTGLTSNKTKTSNSRVGSTVHMGNAITAKLLSDNVLLEKKVLKFETNKPVDFLTDIETDAVICVVMEHIYLTCQFVAQVNHMDSATCFIFTKIGYGRPDQGKERLKQWALQNL